MNEDFSGWVGRTQRSHDRIAPGPLHAMAATLWDKDWDPRPGEPLPPLWHWLFFLPVVPIHAVGPDGHPKRGGFLPPVPLERRMWAGGRLSFHRPVCVGEPIARESEILSVEQKDGAAGPMVFVTVAHRIAGPAGLAVSEEQDIVYLPMPERFAYPKPKPGPEAPDWRDPWAMDPVRLFRFSALTFNGHRIHYDRVYAQDVEKYPGLVVHGPFQAMALMASALDHHPGRSPKQFRFRGVRPLFDFDTLSLAGQSLDDGSLTLATLTEEGHAGMKADLIWAD